MRLCPPACLSASFLTQQPLWHCRIPLCNPECRYEDAVSGGPGMAARRQSLAALLKLGALEACPAWILLFFVTTNLPTFQDPAPHKRTASAPSADVAEEALELLWHSFLALRRNEEGELTMRGLGRLTKSPRNPYLPLLWSAFFDASGAKVRAQRMQRRDAGFILDPDPETCPKPLSFVPGNWLPRLYLWPVTHFCACRQLAVANG